MDQSKIGMLIISTSRGRNWSSIRESYLYNIFLKSFLLTIDKEYEYNVYIGIDKGDPILDNLKEQDEITRFSNAFKNVQFKFIVFDSTVKKGHVSKMWNIIHKLAYDENCNYFYQCGDDIFFRTKGWIKDSVQMLKKNNDIGITGPINNNCRILTQSFVSRKHMDIFGWYFPEQIQNWCIDDWYNHVYHPKHFFPLKNHFCSNDGGEPRYLINNDIYFKNNFSKNTQNLRNYTAQLAKQHKKLIENYIKNNKN